MIKTIGLGVTLSALPAMAMASALSDTFSSFWVLGDSLSDNGNLFATLGVPPAPYFDGRFSNGPVWNEVFLDEFGSDASGNFAFGGARAVTDDDGIPDLAVQTGLFLGASAGNLGDRPLVSFWSGANDLLDELGENDVTVASIQQVAMDAASAVATTIVGLQAVGVEDVLVFNIPDLELTPAFSLIQPDLGDLAAAGTDTYNATLAALLADISGTNITAIDTSILLNDLVADPVSFGVSNTSDPCLFATPEDQAFAVANNLPVFCGPDAANDLAFFDPIHPNATIHAELASLVSAAFIAPVPLPAGLPMLVGALSVFGWMRRRQS